MSKAFTKEDDESSDSDDEIEAAPIPGGKNYITPEGHRKLDAEFKHLMRVERPKVVEVVSWAAGNGDRSENGDYIYGKKRLREIDRRIRFLSQRLKIAYVVDPALQTRRDQVYFGATVSYRNGRGEECRVKIVGADETDSDNGRISWLSPVARALHKAFAGDVVELRTPGALERLEILEIRYEADPS